jgi:uncharacterized membrane protein
MTDRNYDIDLNNSNTKLTQVTMLMYLLMALGFVTGGLTTIAAIVIYYIKREEVSGSWLESHFRWIRNTFWYGLMWTIIAALTWLILLGWFTGGVVTVWLIYRVAKGVIYLNDNKQMNF